MLTVHHLAASQSERIVWLCEELDLPYELVRYAREASGMAPPEYKALYAFGTAPVITDGDLALGESGAIVDYICRLRADGRLIPPQDRADFVDYLFWFHFANGSLIPSAMMDMFGPKREGVASRLDRAFAMIETHLGTATFFAGDVFTAADVMMCLPRMFAKRDLAPWPNIRAYLKRIAARPAWRRAMAKAEPDLQVDFG